MIFGEKSRDDDSKTGRSIRTAIMQNRAFAQFLSATEAGN
jgi:hypothetical protein